MKRGLAPGDRVNVLYGSRIGQSGVIVDVRIEVRPVYSSGVLFGGPSGYLGSRLEGVDLVVEFDDGERLSYKAGEVERALGVPVPETGTRP